MPRTRIWCPIELDGRSVRCETLLGDAGPYTLTLSTTLAEHGISLYSTYLGHPDADETQVAHLLLAPVRAETAAHPSTRRPCQSRTGAGSASTTTSPSCVSSSPK